MRTNDGKGPLFDALRDILGDEVVDEAEVRELRSEQDHAVRVQHGAGVGHYAVLGGDGHAHAGKIVVEEAPNGWRAVLIAGCSDLAVTMVGTPDGELRATVHGLGDTLNMRETACLAAALVAAVQLADSLNSEDAEHDEEED